MLISLENSIRKMVSKPQEFCVDFVSEFMGQNIKKNIILFQILI